MNTIQKFNTSTATVGILDRHRKSANELNIEAAAAFKKMQDLPNGPKRDKAKRLFDRKQDELQKAINRAMRSDFEI